ncbi:polar amino acid transport system substrate-binding protein [Allopseudospirillum japonicum]|uniref:Polar amino acid transport system substrate-binding protein n=1 Tax=Allopseudospirillum japonicum TaxID=64971 RepID=A0A1H6QHC4_9GAMM|nr:transporter substrate-binding domain-containing protein [Allopseudospirillum japonicum]SEI38635.1 polar amino acid transport system substrate-binding protein [Allopseudospirillum japonicum]
MDDEFTQQKNIESSQDTISILIGHYSPFTGRDLLYKGMTSQIVAEALDAINQSYTVTYINDFPAHLNVLLKNRHFDTGHPWFNLGCSDIKVKEANPIRCEYRFSKPIFKTLVMFWKRVDDPFDFQTDSDVHGKRVCRPEGWFTHDLDSPERRWIRDGHITLVQPPNLSECFKLLMGGQVDLVTDQEFGGQEALHQLGIQDQVEILSRPVSDEAMHMLIHRSHPQATRYLLRLNQGLKILQESGRSERIKAWHIDRFWHELEKK